MTSPQSPLGGRSSILVPSYIITPAWFNMLTGLMRYRALWLAVIRWWVGSVERVEVSQDVVMKSLPAAGAALELGYRRLCTMLVM